MYIEIDVKTSSLNVFHDTLKDSLCKQILYYKPSDKIHDYENEHTHTKLTRTIKRK